MTRQHVKHISEILVKTGKIENKRGHVFVWATRWPISLLSLALCIWFWLFLFANVWSLIEDLFICNSFFFFFYWWLKFSRAKFLLLNLNFNSWSWNNMTYLITEWKKSLQFTIHNYQFYRGKNIKIIIYIYFK